MSGQPGPYGPGGWPGGPPPHGGYGPTPGYPQQPAPGYPPQPGYAPPPYGLPPGPPWGAPPRRSNAGVIVLSIVLVLLLAGGGVAAWWFLLRDDGAVALGPGEVFLEPAAALGPEPFTDTFKAGPPPEALAQPAADRPTEIPAGVSVAVPADAGDEPGLYGGTNDQSRCDREDLIRFLEANPAKAAAFAAALDADPTLRWSGGDSLTPGQIRAYVEELTPVDLRTDTRVTNHGFANGRPTPRQSVLQAGTAVLIDRYGVPRVRCACGNPLTPPIAARTPPIYSGNPWPGFTPTSVTVVQQSTTVIQTVTIIDIDSGTPFGRPVGTGGEEDGPAPGADDPPTPSPTPSATTSPTARPSLPPDVTLGTGDVQVTLLWDSDSDLDLHVVDPDGSEVSFSQTSVPSGGQLDRDEVPSCGDGGGARAENVFWPDGGAPSGEYRAFVQHFRACGGAVSYVLEVRVGGQLVESESGTLDEGATSPEVVFRVE